MFILFLLFTIRPVFFTSSVFLTSEPELETFAAAAAALAAFAADLALLRGSFSSSLLGITFGSAVTLFAIVSLLRVSFFFFLPLPSSLSEDEVESYGSDELLD